MKWNQRKVGSALFVLLCLLLAHSVAHAKINRLALNVFYHVTPDATSKAVVLSIIVKDDLSRRPPEVIKSMTITTPPLGTTIPGKTYTVPFKDVWSEYYGDFTVTLDTSFFGTSTTGVVPSGKYTVKVEGNDGTATTAGTILIASETLPNFLTSTGAPANFISIPTIITPAGSTNPASPAVLSTRTPTFQWAAVSGAMVYRVSINQLWSSTADPVYQNTLYVTAPVTSFTIPVGVFQPKSVYNVRIEARDAEYNLQRRSRSYWYFYKTP